ncbi:MAG: hypothetical protein IKG52_11085 [Rhodobacteraceae bacterium]|nr:hypothetical protein [Paracoccaceae bacterium]
MITITRKFGDTLRLRFHTEFPLDDVTVDASARDSAGTTRPLGVTLVSPPDRLIEVWGDDLAPLPVGRHAIDLKYSRAGQIMRTATFYLQIRERITP